MTAVAPTVTELPPKETAPVVVGEFGRFSPDGREFWITDPRTPRPWANIIANPRMGLAVSQTGSGFTWIDNSQLAVITRWQQDLASDSSGRAIYVRDLDSQELWSLAPAPVWRPDAKHECRHGLGYTTFITEVAGIRSEWTLFVHADQTVELWRVELHNLTDQARRLELCGCLEWNCGVAPSPRREFHKLFIETAFDPEQRAVFAWNHMWEVSSARDGYWNASFPYVAAFGATDPVSAAQGDKSAFIGRYGDRRSPEALTQTIWEPSFGRHDDPIAALRVPIELQGGQQRGLGFALAVGESRGEATRLLQSWSGDGTEVALDRMNAALDEVRAGWRSRLADHRIDTPEPSLNFLVNDWVRYQAVSSRLWGRCGYYQQSGAYGYRDQLQDSQVWLTIDPQQCREQANLHAGHQFADGSVYHWWHPLTEQGHIARMTDDLLWLSFVTANYIKETGDLSILNDATPFLDDAERYPLVEHVLRAFRRVFARTSPRGLPYIGAGDWNDGLSAVGLQESGESIWLGHFLVGLLADWAEIFRRAAASATDPVPDASLEWPGLAEEFSARRRTLIAAVNEHGWDGEWYLRATLDDGSKLGSRDNRVGRIFLNAQTWAILNDVAPPERAVSCWNSVRTHLISDAGALLLAPAFDTPDERVGYITRYGPGLRENGGVYTHAATWAIAAACKMKDHESVGRLLTAINPALKDPERFWSEPYVLPGNVDGPDSPHFGRGGWSWYTGSAQWLHRVVTQWVLGVRPEWDGLRIDPCMPPGWRRARMTRPWRGCSYELTIERADGPRGEGGAAVSLDGKLLSGDVLPCPVRTGERHDVHIRIDRPTVSS